MGKIYIIIPVYNVEYYLKRCLSSIIKQTFSNYEVILVDDGSTDESGFICDEYSSLYENIIVFHQNNAGCSVARNVGIEYVLNLWDKESWITFLDGDDYVHPYYLEYLLEAAYNYDANISCCYYKVTKETEKFCKLETFKSSSYTPEELWTMNRSNAILAWGKLYRAELFNTIRYPSGRIYEDEFTTYKLLFSQDRIAYIATPLYFYYINMNSITQREWTPNRLDELDAIEEQIEFFKSNGYILAYGKSYGTLCSLCILNLRYVEALAPKYNYLHKELKKRLINYLLGYGKEFGYVKSCKTWFNSRIRQPLNRVLKNENIISYVKFRITRIIKRNIIGRKEI